MAFSTRSLAGLLHPAADPGVRDVAGLCPLPLRVPDIAFPVCASTLRSFFLAVSPLHSLPLGKSLPSCRCLAHADPEIFAFSFSFEPLASLFNLLGTLARTKADFRAFSRRSSPPRREGVSTSGRVWLPWVSHPARDLFPVGPLLAHPSRALRCVSWGLPNSLIVSFHATPWARCEHRLRVLLGVTPSKSRRS
jgi:hypothetical protein